MNIAAERETRSEICPLVHKEKPVNIQCDTGLSNVVPGQPCGVCSTNQDCVTPGYHCTGPKPFGLRCVETSRASRRVASVTESAIAAASRFLIHPKRICGVCLRLNTNSST